MHTSRHKGPRQYTLHFLTPYRVLVTVVGCASLTDSERTRLYREGYVRQDNGVYCLPGMEKVQPTHVTTLRQSPSLPRRVDLKFGRVARAQA